MRSNGLSARLRMVVCRQALNAISWSSAINLNGRSWRRVQPIAATHSANFSAGV
jgi:hypothetical protein